MNVKNVFIGLTNDGTEVLLYKNKDCFINLKTKEVIDFNEVIEEKLFSYTDIISQKGFFCP